MPSPRFIYDGRIKLYCTESNVAEAWTRRDSDPTWRMERHRAFESYVMQELVPWIRTDCRTPDIPIAVSGTSLGATYSANFALKFPETFRYALCMSGQYDITRITDGFNNTDVYFNNPVAYASNLNGSHLDRHSRPHPPHPRVRSGQVGGRQHRGHPQSRRHSSPQGNPHLKDMWGRDVHHEWDSWRRQAILHLNHRFGG